MTAPLTSEIAQGSGCIKEDAPRLGVIVGLAGTRQVFVNGVELSPRDSARVIPFLEGGFYWGSKGRGSSQLALAILLRFVDEGTAVSLYSDFEREVIVAQAVPDRPLSLVVKRIRAWLGGKGVKV
jgi:hypothetical protein